MAATICALAVSWVLEAGCSKVDDTERREEGKTHGRRATRAGRESKFPSEDERKPDRLRGDVGESTAIRTAQIQSKNRSDQVRAVNQPVEAVILVPEVLEEGRHRVLLVVWEVKVVREAASGEDRRDLGVVGRSADTCDKWTYKKAWRCGKRLIPMLVSACKQKQRRHTYKLRERWGGTGHGYCRSCP